MLIPESVRANLRLARLDRGELSGSLGDLGTFLPLLVGMSVQNGLSFASGLFFAGLFNVVTGLAFAVPMAVQPMKAIAAVALTEGLTVPEILAAGATVSAVVLVLGLSGLIDGLNRIIPKSVVRGLQLALGLSLLMKAAQMVTATHTWLGPDSYVVGLLALAAAMTLFFSDRVPVALLLFGAGLGLAMWKAPGVVQQLGVGFTLPVWTPIAWADAVSAFPKAALPQISLTTLNSVIAVCALSGDLFPGQRVGPRKVAISVGIMNLVSAPFGGMPLCHGAGGLAGQFRFGARTNGSILFLGMAKMALAVLLGSSLIALLGAFPRSILGVMLAVSGLELALVVRDQVRPPNAFVALVTAGACLGLGNVGLGFCLGLLIAWSTAAVGRYRAHREEERGRRPN